MHSLYINAFYQDTCLQRINFKGKKQKDRQKSPVKFCG